MTYYYIYEITNLINGKMYIGQHRTNNLDDGNRNKHPSNKTRKMMSEKAKIRTGVKNPFFGKHHSDEAKRKNREAHLGKHWYSDGKTNILTRVCPYGFHKGRMVRGHCQYRTTKDRRD